MKYRKNGLLQHLIKIVLRFRISISSYAHRS